MELKDYSTEELKAELKRRSDLANGTLETRTAMTEEAISEGADSKRESKNGEMEVEGNCTACSAI